MNFGQFFELTERLDQLVAELNSEWMVYDGLFGDRANFDILNQSGPLAWLEIRDALISSILLGIGRLLDPAQTMGRENLSIAYVLAAAPHNVSGSTGAKIDQLKEKYQAVAKVWRNRAIGHNDHRTTTGLDPLPELPASMIAALIAAVNATCNAISQDLMLSEVEYAPRYRDRNWVPQLVRVLCAGVAALPPQPPDEPDEDDEES